MIYRLPLYLLVAVACYFVSLEWSHGFKSEDYKNYLSLISSVSGMVFTIMGIWIAFLYPNAMIRIVSPDKLVAKDFTESKSDAKRLENIVGAVMTSALVMITVLLIALAKIILPMTPIYLENIMQFKAAALSALMFITFAQLDSVFYVVLSNVMFINDLHFNDK